MRRQKLISALLAFPGILFLKYVFIDFGDEISFTNSLFSVLLFAVLYLLILKALSFTHTDTTFSQKLITALCSVLFVLAMSVGRMMEQKLNLTVSPVFLLAVIVWGVITTLILRAVYQYMLNAATLRKSETEVQLKDTDHIQVCGLCVSIDLLTFLGLMMAYLIVFLAVYPGFFVYDAYTEWSQADSGLYMTYHPLLHVLLLGKVIQSVYHLTGSYNLGIAAYTVLQMLFFAFLFTYILSSLRREAVSLKSHLIFALYYMFFPVISMFVLCSTKDSLFSAFLVLTFFLMRRLFLQTDVFLSEKKCSAMMIVSTTLALCFRYNALYAYVIFGILAFIFLKRKVRLNKTNFYRSLLILTLPVVCAISVNTVLPRILKAEPAGSQEMLTVPIMQLARVYAYEKEEMTKEDLALLENYIPPQYLNLYTPRLSDFVKCAFRNEVYEQDPGAFYSLWLRQGLQHPFAYVKAWLYTSYGFWYPDAVINVYKGNERYTYTYEDSSYFAYEVEMPGVRDSKIPALDAWFKKLSLELTQQRVPVISMLFSPGFMFMLYLFFVGYFIYAKKTRLVFPYLLLGLLWLTYLLGPTYLVRYVIFLWFALPILLTDFMKRDEDKVCND